MISAWLAVLSRLMDASQNVVEAQSKAPQDIRNVVNFLRSSKAGIKVRMGALNGKRTEYFKGLSSSSPNMRAAR